MKLREVYGINYNKDGTLKLSQSPTFCVVNGELTYSATPSLKISVGAKNLFDYQQNDTESPLIYDKDGNLTDVIYIWGPLLGRLVYVRCSISID